MRLALDLAPMMVLVTSPSWKSNMVGMLWT